SIARSGLSLLPFLNRLRPVVLEQPREGAVGQEFPASLAARTVVGFVLRPYNPLHRGSTDRAGLSEAAMHRHFGAKGSHLLRELRFGLRQQSFGPGFK